MMTAVDNFNNPTLWKSS